MSRADFKNSGLFRYAAGLAAAGASLLLRATITPLLGARFPLLFGFLAIIVVANYCGVGPAIAATIAAVAGGAIFFHDRQWNPSEQSVGLLAYLLGAFLFIFLVEAVHRASRRAEERLAQLRHESARREREQEVSAQLRAIVESSDDAIASMDLACVVASWNRAAERIFGYAAAEVVGRPISILTPADRAAEESRIIAQIRAGGRAKPFETVRTRKSGEPIQVSLTISPIHDPRGALAGASYIARDITERKQFEQRLLETQKLESLGVLAGGLAHDFNNLLTGIMGNASLVLATLPDATARRRLEEVLLAGDRAALLVSQMLAYAGKGAISIGQLDLSREIEELSPLIRTSVPRSIALDFHLAARLPLIEADRSQLQQLVMNLAINASESIESRAGIVSIATAAGDAPGGAYVELEVKDTGCGMDEATKARIFDPFFTTKFTGRGLGLAAVMGIVRANRGEISVESAPGQGSRFRIVFPAARQSAIGAPSH